MWYSNSLIGIGLFGLAQITTGLESEIVSLSNPIVNEIILHPQKNSVFLIYRLSNAIHIKEFVCLHLHHVNNSN